MLVLLFVLDYFVGVRHLIWDLVKLINIKIGMPIFLWNLVMIGVNLFISLQNLLYYEIRNRSVFDMYILFQSLFACVIGPYFMNMYLINHTITNYIVLPLNILVFFICLGKQNIHRMIYLCLKWLILIAVVGWMLINYY